MSCEDPKRSEHEEGEPPLPDPNGLPQPVDDVEPLKRFLATVRTVGMVLGGLVLVALAFPHRTAGSTRSTQLQWQDRQDQIEQASQEDAAYRNSENETSP